MLESSTTSSMGHPFRVGVKRRAWISVWKQRGSGLRVPRLVRFKMDGRRAFRRNDFTAGLELGSFLRQSTSEAREGKVGVGFKVFSEIAFGFDTL